MDREMGWVTFKELDNGDWGRLGNQLFEIAAVFGIALNSFRNPSLPKDWRYKKDFTIPEIYFNIGHDKGYQDYTNLSHFYCDPPEGNINLRGWFQSYKYFHTYQRFIKSLFNPFKIQQLDYCAIHIRRTDYLAFGWDVCDKKYYSDLINKYNENKILVFSDDIEWCRNEFGSDFEYSEEDEITELFRMASCQRIIAANSSYSWWACYLSNHNNCHFPRTWVKGIPYTETELILPEWENANKHD